MTHGRLFTDFVKAKGVVQLLQVNSGRYPALAQSASSHLFFWSRLNPAIVRAPFEVGHRNMIIKIINKINTLQLLRYLGCCISPCFLRPVICNSSRSSNCLLSLCIRDLGIHFTLRHSSSACFPSLLQPRHVITRGLNHTICSHVQCICRAVIARRRE